MNPAKVILSDIVASHSCAATILLYKFSQMPQIFTEFFLYISVKSVRAKIVAGETRVTHWETIEQFQLTGI
jgi:hypothetical protein